MVNVDYCIKNVLNISNHSIKIFWNSVKAKIVFICSRHEIAQSLASTKNNMVKRRQEDNHVTLNHPHVVLYLVQYMTNWYEAVVHYSIFLGWFARRFDFYFRFQDRRGKAPKKGCICTPILQFQNLKCWHGRQYWWNIGTFKNTSTLCKLNYSVSD